MPKLSVTAKNRKCNAEFKASCQTGERKNWTAKFLNLKVSNVAYLAFYKARWQRFCWIGKPSSEKNNVKKVDLLCLYVYNKGRYQPSADILFSRPVHLAIHCTFLVS